MTIEELVDKKALRSRMEAIYWAGALIWVGLVFLAEELGFIPQIGNASAWSWALLGVGLYGTGLNLYSTIIPDISVTTTGDYLWSGFWLVLGLSGFFAFNVFLPIVLLVIGLAILVKGVLWTNESR